MLDALALPGLRSRLAGLRHGPESPDFLAGGLVEGGEEAARAVFAAAEPGDHQIAHGQRRGRGEVVLMPVGHLGVPDQLAGEAVERDQVGVVGVHEDAVAGHGHAAIGAAGGVARQAGWARGNARSRGRCRRRARSIRWPPART